MRIRPALKKQTGCLAGRSLISAIYACIREFSAARLRAPKRQDTGHTPRKLPRRDEQSPASSHRLRAVRASLYTIPKTLRQVKLFFRKNATFFQLICTKFVIIFLRLSSGVLYVSRIYISQLLPKRWNALPVRGLRPGFCGIRHPEKSSDQCSGQEIEVFADMNIQNRINLCTDLHGRSRLFQMVRAVNRNSQPVQKFIGSDFSFVFSRQ